MDADRAPETAAEFERLLAASPNSSYIWIKYMALHLNMTEIDKAREVSDRALKSINFREEGERFNVWVARLNLEGLYGSRDGLMSAFEEVRAAGWLVGFGVLGGGRGRGGGSAL